MNTILYFCDIFQKDQLKDGDFDLHCASFCTGLCLSQYNSFKQHKMNQLFRKKNNNEQSFTDVLA